MVNTDQLREFTDECRSADGYVVDVELIPSGIQLSAHLRCSGLRYVELVPWDGLTIGILRDAADLAVGRLFETCRTAFNSAPRPCVVWEGFGDA